LLGDVGLGSLPGDEYSGHARLLFSTELLQLAVSWIDDGGVIKSVHPESVSSYGSMAKATTTLPGCLNRVTLLRRVGSCRDAVLVEGKPGQ
jgi:hypothetical protein